MVAIAEKLKRRKIDNGEDNAGKEEETWSILPDDLLWMIRERLNFVQNLCVAAVCKNWWSSSPICSDITTTTARFSLPWIMGYRGRDSTEQKFIDPWYRKKYIINLPDLSEARVIYSKEGWLLLIKTIGVNYVVRETPTGPKSIEGRKAYSPFLFNPLTKSKIELPKLPYVTLLAGTFSIRDGALSHVAFATYDHDIILPLNEHSLSPNFFITSLGDRGKSGDDGTSSWMWLKYTPTFAVRQIMDDVVGFFILGDLLYCFDPYAGMLVFDLLTLTWKEYRRSRNLKMSSSILECEGEIIDMQMSTKWQEDGVKFFKWNLSNSSDSNEIDWVELKDDDALIQDRVWFIGGTRYSSFTRKVLDGGRSMKKKVYYCNNFVFQDMKTAKWIFNRIDGLENLGGVFVDQRPDGYLPPLWVDIS
ncbi:uncharacterized protein LOC122645113 [Telopea speciosissima]|uniref:uncharacterized protein LOC122645113 n=1 Tax=Telopea speciosissima TaxID=54955 RepID=UPI001CC51140|nr:uncharacterized protein LOC122645113 [Telopea speciosissima]